jgi:hypothetical protein
MKDAAEVLPPTNKQEMLPIPHRLPARYYVKFQNYLAGELLLIQEERD